MAELKTQQAVPLENIELRLPPCYPARMDNRRALAPSIIPAVD